MDQISTTQILSKSFHNKLQRDTLEVLRQVSQRRTYPPQAILCHQGAREHTFFVIVEGRVAAVQTLENGEERLLNVLQAGEYFGEMGLVDDAPRMATCTALTDTVVLEITEEVFDQLITENPTVAYLIMRQILTHARSLDRQAVHDLTQKNRALEQAYADLQAAQAQIVEKERLEHELQLAAEMQLNLLPGDLPVYADYHFAAYLQPARHVGGDFYDVIPLDEEHVGLLIADVADKGVHAALLMAVVRTLFLQEGGRSLSPAAVTEAVHQGFMAVTRSSQVFVTVFYGVLHRPTGCLRYVRAGHERPLLLSPDQTITPLPGRGRFLGMLPDLTLPEFTVQLHPGDRLVLFSDGVSDAINEAGVHFGHERLQELVQAGNNLVAVELVHHVVNKINLWSRGALPFDDVTLLVIEAL